mmetsp:Transcript_33744/g.95475  ORF Transcript_33744/g.95475 Transcript_33744/m.95475 type:complete len:292 (-) Transcript_33744:1161-2036(-)
MDSRELLAEEAGLEEDLGTTEPLIANDDDLPVWQLIALLELAAGSGGGHLLLVVEGNIAELLLDVPHNLALCGGGEGVAALEEDGHQVVGEITASQIQAHDGVWKGIPLINWDSVGHTISGIQNDTGGTAAGVQRQDGLDLNIHGGHVEGLKHDLCHFLAVGLGVQGSLGQQHRVLLGSDTELIVEGVMPDLLHIIPVADNTMLDGVLEGEDTALGLGLVTHIRVFLAHANHDTLVSRAAHNAREHSAGSIISSKSSLDHSGSIVAHQGRNLSVVSHCERCLLVNLAPAME